MCGAPTQASVSVIAVRGVGKVAVEVAVGKVGDAVAEVLGLVVSAAAGVIVGNVGVRDVVAVATALFTAGVGWS